ncbi:sulfurtransferase [Salinisphaera orenii]|uniref:sulfurtransferase n=1 Tax=Salinisphaera orenii TaxID=856731 RepID=UPI000DBE618F
MASTLPVFIDPKTLADAVDRDDVQIVAVDSAADFTTGHIEGAHRIDLDAIVASQGPFKGLLPERQVIADACSAAGLRNDATIVAYDRAGDAQAARLLYTLDAMGHDRISLLDGGLAAWVNAGQALVSGQPKVQRTDFRVERRDSTIADRNWIEKRLDSDDTQFLDVRSVDEYAGRDVRSAYGGHVPGAAHLDWTDLKDANGCLKPRSEIEALLSKRGLSPDQDVATYCQSHMRSSYAYLVLKALGYTGARGYPGAWSDWGNRDDTPKETGDPVDA